MLRTHPLFAPLVARAHFLRNADSICPADGWCVVVNNGYIHCHRTRRAEPEQWLYCLGHALLHLGFAHFHDERRALEWNAACDVAVTRFLMDIKLGSPPEELRVTELPSGTETRLYDSFCAKGIPVHLRKLSTGGAAHVDLFYLDKSRNSWIRESRDWQAGFAFGLRQALKAAIDVASGRTAELTSQTSTLSAAQRARAWFISSYPLLGAMIAAFEIIEDSAICMREEIGVAAVNAQTREIFINPGIGLNEQECRFVIAHETLHVGLSHNHRTDGRDAYLWNIACDFVVNGWLIEMNIGTLPQVGGLYDPELKGLSAESIYDRITTDMRRFRKLATMRGQGLGDMLGPSAHGPHSHGTDLDEFYRNAMSQGLEYHIAEGRGYLPLGLVEAIRALNQPSIPWDVELARWFDDYFEPLEKQRTYARPSRRQSSTPDIPRPRYVPRDSAEDGRTFGVVLDTSGSMDRLLLAKALGAIASYSQTHDVPRVRVIFCDAATYDQGYMPPDALAGSVKIHGRGGTILQPAIDLLEKAEDFPKDGPLLIITDGQCDRLVIRREHAILTPKSARLPFVPRGPVFRMQ